MAASNGRDRLSPLALIAVLLGAAIMLAPLVWTLLLSLKANSALVGNSVVGFPPAGEQEDADAQ